MFRLVPKSTTFDDPERPICILLEKRCGCRQQQFSAFSLAMSLETSEIRPALLYSDMQSVVGFSVIPKFLTSNDVEWLFRVKFCFRTGLHASHRATFEKNCVKTNKETERHILSAARIFQFLAIRFVRIFARIL